MLSLYIISSNEIVAKESEAINALFENGMHHFHLRKKTWMKAEVIELLEKINSAYYKHIALHHHPELVFEYDLAGFHFNSAYPYQEKIATKLREAQKTVSVSSHNICDIGEYELEADYQFVSPIFPSISKSNQVELFDQEKLKNYFVLKPKSKFIALSGVEPKNLKEIKELRFDGAAVLGYLWEAFQKDADITNIVTRYNNLNLAISEELI